MEERHIVVLVAFLSCLSAASSQTAPLPSSSASYSAHVSSLSPPPSLSPSPSPSPPPSSFIIPDVDYYAYGKPANQTDACIHLHAGMQMEVTYDTPDGKQDNTTILVVRNATVVYDDDATNCNQKTPFMTVRWTTEPGNDYHLRFEFKTDGGQWELFNVTFNYTVYKDFPDNIVDYSAGMAVLNSTFMQRTELNHYYGCTTMQTFDFRDTNGSMEITMRVQNLLVQAFNFSNTTGGFDLHSYGNWCDADHRTDDLVSIVVGAVLGGLVVTVILLYGLGRLISRSKRREYEALQ